MFARLALKKKILITPLLCVNTTHQGFGLLFTSKLSQIFGLKSINPTDQFKIIYAQEFYKLM